MAAKPQLYRVTGIYVSDRGQIIEPYGEKVFYFHYLKDARAFAYKKCKETGHREAYFSINGPSNNHNDWGKNVGTYIKSNGMIYFEDRSRIKHPVRSGGRKKTPAPFGL